MSSVEGYQENLMVEPNVPSDLKLSIVDTEMTSPEYDREWLPIQFEEGKFLF